jgi:hypothetical protein
MTFRNLTPALLALATLSAPAHADVLPPGTHLPPVGHAERLAPGDPLGYRPAPAPSVPGGASNSRLFDAPITGSGPIASPTLLASWRGAPPGWNPPGLDRPRDDKDDKGGQADKDGKHDCPQTGTRPSPCPPKPPKPPMPVPGVPGPLPVVGVAAAWGWSRKLRRRVGIP